MAVKRILRGLLLVAAALVLVVLALRVRDGRDRGAAAPTAERAVSPSLLEAEDPGTAPVEAAGAPDAGGHAEARSTQEATGIEITELCDDATNSECGTRLRIREVRADEREWAEGTDVELEHTSADGEHVTLTSERGRTLIEQRVTDLDGHVRLTLGDVVLTTDHARHENAHDQVRSDARVEIEGPGWRVSGRGFEVELERQRVHVLHDVVTWIEPAADGSGAVPPGPPGASVP